MENKEEDSQDLKKCANEKSDEEKNDLSKFSTNITNKKSLIENAEKN